MALGHMALVIRHSDLTVVGQDTEKNTGLSRECLIFTELIFHIPTVVIEII